MIYTKIVV